MPREGERITVREDALQDAPRLMRHCGKAGKVIQCWPMATRPLRRSLRSRLCTKLSFDATPN